MAGIMLALRRKGWEEGMLTGRKDLSFYRLFRGMVEKKGEIREFHLGLRTALRKFPLHPIEDAILLFKLWRRGKLR